MSIDIKIADEKDMEQWEEAVSSSSYATIFHTWKWLNIAKKHTNLELYPLMAYRGTTLVGIYPVFLKRKGFVKIAFSPPPKAYLLYLGPVILNYENLKQDKKESVFRQFQEEVDKYLFSELKCNYVRIRTSPGLFDSRPFRWSGYEIEPLYTYRINLSRGQDNVWDQFDRKLRVDINKAVREGVVIEEGTKDDLEFIHGSLSRRYVEQGFNPSDYCKYLSELFDEFHPHNMKIFIATYKGEKVGGTISLCYKDVVYLWVGVPKSDLKGISPNDLVQWEAIKWACNNGFKYYEEMDAGDDPRLTYFKSKYNPELVIWYSAVRYSAYAYRIADKSIRRLRGK
ncbi:MAG TPA: GNAT family N-acetyltransferase [Candidatus Methanoperedens sp.]